MKILVPNYSCLQNPWLRGYCPPDPRSVCPLSSTEFVEPPEQNSWVCHCWHSYTGWPSAFDTHCACNRTFIFSCQSSWFMSVLPSQCWNKTSDRQRTVRNCDISRSPLEVPSPLSLFCKQLNIWWFTLICPLDTRKYFTDIIDLKIMRSPTYSTLLSQQQPTSYCHWASSGALLTVTEPAIAPFIPPLSRQYPTS